MSRGVRVLTYHRVCDRTHLHGADPSLLSATPAGFDRQMRHLAAHYRPVSAAEVIAAFRQERPLPQRAVLVTFDDGYRDFGEIAWPIMRRHGIPATLFVATAFAARPEREFWWDRLHRATAVAPAPGSRAATPYRPPSARPDLPDAGMRELQSRLKQMPHAEAMALVTQICGELHEQPTAPSRVLGWDELRALAADGVTLGGHTRNHPALDQLPPAQVRAEVAGGRADLEREIGPVLPIFAYPFGACNDCAVEAVRSAGYELALTCQDGHSLPGATDPLRLPRTNISPRTTPFIFRLRLLRLVARLDRWRHARRTA
jgi:peptidoglycan/xylan/chitin deacetylase (PgdA/CDA1 family)